MKGITHFSVGLAIASCFPAAVRAGAEGNPLYFLIGGICGLLPDTLDFRFVRFLFAHHTEIAPDPLAPDPALIANAVAGAVAQASLSGRTVRLKLDSMPLGDDEWLRYSVHFDVAQQKVQVEIQDIVDTGGQIIAPPPVPAGKRFAAARLPVAVHIEYTATTLVDIFDGPMFAMEPAADGAVTVRFIPWHREWTHSLPLAAALGVVVAGITNAGAGAIAALAFAAHALVDHLGQLGVNLMHPFSKRRRWGLGWLSSSHALGNFAFTWASGCIVFWNLYRATAIQTAAIHPAALLLAGLAPCVLLRITRHSPAH